MDSSVRHTSGVPDKRGAFVCFTWVTSTRSSPRQSRTPARLNNQQTETNYKNDIFKQLSTHAARQGVICTVFEVTPEAISDRVGFNQKYDTNILDINPGSRHRDGEDQKTHKIVFGSYGGIVVFTEQNTNGSWFANGIHFNPRNLLYRHNGHRLSVDDFTVALTILREQVAKIQRRPDDIIHIVPGVHPQSKASWSTLEIAIDLADPDGQLEERVFQNPHYPKMKEGFRHRDGTVQIGSSDGPLKLKFYRKDKQMAKLLRKYHIKDAPRILRVEVTLSQKKLLEHLGKNDNIRMIDGKNRLVRFAPIDQIECLLRIVTQLKGCYPPIDGAAGKAKSMDKTGRFMALLATRFNIPLVDLFDLYETQIGCSGETKGRQRRAAHSMMAKISPVRFDEIFSDANLQRQPSIVIPKLEATVAYRRQQVMSALDIEMTYGQSLPFPIQHA